MFYFQFNDLNLWASVLERIQIECRLNSYVSIKHLDKLKLFINEHNKVV